MYPIQPKPIMIVANVVFGAAVLLAGDLKAQSGLPSDTSSGLRPVQNSGPLPSTSAPVMVPLNSPGSMGFDPYATAPSTLSNSSGVLTPSLLFPGASVPPPMGMSSGMQPYSSFQPGYGQGGFGQGVYPSYTGPPPILPGSGPSAIVQTNPGLGAYQPSGPGMYPNTAPSALFPGNYGSTSGSAFGNWFGGTNGTWFGGGGAGAYPSPPGYGAPAYNWNPFAPGPGGQPPAFIRLFQGPRFRHAYIHGEREHDALSINDTDVALAFVIPQILCSTQPLYLLPSFSLHQWSGPFPHLDPGTTADMPSKAFSAFLDTGWQSDPAAIFGLELGVRVGVFSDFDAISSESLRVLGRGIGRVRLTPQATMKLGVMYLDRNRVQLLPAGGILWQPNPGTRLDLFFPEPKLSAYLTTLGNHDTWWYVAGYYGGGTWTVERNDGSHDAVDINDIRVVLGLEWGRNDMMRDGRRVGFAEVGYVFDRELIYKRRPEDNLDVQDNFMVRIGFGY